MKHPLGDKKIIFLPATIQEGQIPDLPVKVEEVDSMMCHVSPKLIDGRLEPSTKSTHPDEPAAIFFTENEFMSNYGDFLYLFSKKLLVEKYGLMYRGVGWHRMVRANKIIAEKGRFEEFVCLHPIEITDAIAVIQHRNLSPNFFNYKRLEG